MGPSADLWEANINLSVPGAICIAAKAAMLAIQPSTTTGILLAAQAK